MSLINTNCLHDGAVYETIEVDQIDFNEANDYEPTNIEELAEDIKHNGLLHNIVVVKKDDGRYKLLAGERRLRAIKLLADQEPESWKSLTALVYSGLTSRQEEIIMDSSNLHARSAGGSEVQLRKATNRYMDNIKAEYGLNETEALKATTEIYNGSGNTVRANRKIEQGLNEGLKEKLDSGAIEKGDAVVLADMAEEEQQVVLQQIEDAGSDEDAGAAIEEAVTEHKEKKAAQKAEKKAAKKKDNKTKKPEQEESPVTVSQVSPQDMVRIKYRDTLESLISQVRNLNTPDIVAQIKRLDSGAEEGESLIATVYQLSMEVTALKIALDNASGEIELPKDPKYGHSRGNKDEEGYVEGSEDEGLF